MAAARANEKPLSAGLAVVDITPPVGYRMSGYFRERPSTGVHDPLLAKALVLEQGDVQAALVFCDLVGVALDVSREARRRIERETGVPAANVMIAATHSHTGPLYFGAMRKHFHEQAVARHGADPLEAVDYAAVLTDKLVEAVALAQQAARPARLEAGVAEQLGLSFNRRFHMRDGGVRFNPGRRNPDIVRVAGPIDPEVGLVKIHHDGAEAPAAMLTVFALHLDTVGGTEYGADYPYYLEEALRERLGPGLISMFGAGTCGDINHIDVTSEANAKGQNDARRIGRVLAETVAAAELEPVEQPALAVRSTTVDAPLQRYTEAEIEQARQDLFKIGGRELSFLDQVRAYKIMALELRGGETLPIEVQVFRLGDDAALVGLPGEVFVELGLAIKRRSPFRTTLVVELTNDAPGYLPTRKAFAEGSYETVNSRIASGGAEQMVEAAVRLLEELRPAAEGAR